MHTVEGVASDTSHRQSFLSTESSRHRADDFLPGPLSAAQYCQLLTGMVAQGHGIEAICLFLSLTRDSLLDLVVRLDLPTPHDRPQRRTGGARAWLASDYATLLSGWLGNWPTGCLAQQVGRSRGSIWAKSRRMGLPKRERRLLSWPAIWPPHPPPPAAEASIEPAKPEPPKKLPVRWPVRGTDTPLELTSQRDGREVNWTDNRAALIEMGMRAWAGQRLRKIAEDFGVSYRTVTSQLQWLEAMAPKDRGEHTDVFDRAVALANIKAARCELRPCQNDPRFSYWRHCVRRNRSKRDVRAGFYDAALA